VLLTLLDTDSGSLRDCISETVDCLRHCADLALDLPTDEVYIRTRTWSGSAPGDGTFADVDTYLTPQPRSSSPDPTQTANPYGTFEDGTLRFEKVSLAYTDAFLGDPSGRPSNVETFWVVNGEEYSLIQVDSEYASKSVILRRRRGR